MGGSSCSRNRNHKFHCNRYTVNKKVDINVTVTTSAKKLDQRLIDDDQMKDKTLSGYRIIALDFLISVFIALLFGKRGQPNVKESQF
ncbi:hypothetical protein NPIL_552581 [Nephila pilipes]|uniref:Transmembrane protein n=1 Tax=Nephila pilipes TaxID=299642 RepID=A0A8X6Q831_NEPPI|nr:hypothetical protein NPIL_552581 [Nephila pilipes]